MPEPLTIRRQMIETLMSGLYSARDLAHLYAIPERQVEDHLTHIVRSLEHDPARRFLMPPGTHLLAALQCPPTTVLILSPYPSIELSIRPEAKRPLTVRFFLHRYWR